MQRATCWVAAWMACSAAVAASEPLSPAHQTALAVIAARTGDIQQVNRAIWSFAELGLEEYKSSALLVDRAKAAGFSVQTGVAGMPTAFIASYGSGQPIIGLLAEYDALPDLSQKASPVQEPLEPGKPGHGCGHSGLGAGALGAAIAIKEALERHRLPGTIRLYGTPAEETTIGKVYMQLAGVFNDLDICLHWHPSSKNEVWAGSSKALVSAKFTFTGLAAHAAGSPEQGRSALDGVELMNIGVNFMREHVKEDARLHYVVTDGGGAPNVVPNTATVWYFVRADDHKDVERYFAWVQDIAKGAALMSQTRLSLTIDTDCHELIPNRPLAELMHQNLLRLPPPKFTAEELAFAARLQAPLAEQFGRKFELPLDDSIHELPAVPETTKGSTDVGDISWHVPTGGLRTACFAVGSPGHCWQNVAAIGSSIGDKGTIYAAQVLACTALDLFLKPQLVAAAKADFAERMKNRPYTTLIPKGQKPPVKIR
uniref:Amidohydrolase n=1 Tax=Schlesneria paludicola TaxID=360056 RepID=A0A7C4LL20_9PLAN